MVKFVPSLISVHDLFVLHLPFPQSKQAALSSPDFEEQSKYEVILVEDLFREQKMQRPLDLKPEGYTIPASAF
jgi:hypothetical protein